MSLFWLIVFVGGALTLAYRRVDLRTAAYATGVALALYTVIGDGGFLWYVWLLLLWLAFGVMVAMNVVELRLERVTRPLLGLYRTMLPSMSSTEREALEAGTVWWEGELFTGQPDWSKLIEMPAPRLSAEEQAFLDGPVEELCRMIDTWDITHERADLPPQVWKFLKTEGFFAMIIPKRYGGLEFSASGHSAVLVKAASRSTTVASTIAVPNSLGPAELLLHYGTEEQKTRWLPGLAKGEEVPCFALTGPTAGSDAASLPDTGIVCKGTWEGEEIVGMRLNWDKRYITLAPVATVVGLAFRLYDPDHLIGETEDYGITVALVPRKTNGITAGRRHLPLNTPFQNGPTQGKNVFVPLDCIIGGPDMAGQGWRMLMEQLAVGRCISLPSNTTGGALAAVYASGAYCRIRRQFHLPIGRFQGVEQALARMTGYAYTMNAARAATIAAVDQGERPAVPAAILKYHVTEMARQVGNDAMDVHGGKGICLGPRNYLGRGYQSIPIAITVEGANILTRSLIIFGQGAIRCHPYVLREIEAAGDQDTERGLQAFDRALTAHVGNVISNAARSLVMGTTLARFASTPVAGPTGRFYQHINRFSASFALAADVAMLTLGGSLKKKELVSARLGDVLSSLYLASMVLKHYHNQGRPEADLPLVEWSCRHLLYRAQEQLHIFLRNFPNRWVAAALRVLVFPRGLTYFAPSDRLGHQVVNLIMHPSESRKRLSSGIYRTPEPGNPLGLLQEAMELAVHAEPIERRLHKAEKSGEVTALDSPGRIEQGIAAGILSQSEGKTLAEFDARVMALIAVDDFTSEELARVVDTAKPRTRQAAAKKTAVKKTAPKTAQSAKKKDPTAEA